jgi:lipopolysaccharide biosynthesis protein
VDQADSIRLIAFYLPQFHPIPENDAWWGEGFTEWRNVARARPLFEGHYQPHIPADLGFYDLRLPEARRAQAELARAYGIYGFCYYHYWFHGRQLLERPFNEVFTTRQPDFPFCLCWANESWSRRWDGSENEVLVQQSYSAEDDARHIAPLLPYFKDPRYIKIGGRPLFLIYRVDALPNPAGTAQLWRRAADEAGLPGVYLCDVISSGVLDPEPTRFGLDAAVEFQPDWRNLPPLIFQKQGGRVARLLHRGSPATPPVRSYPELVASTIGRPEPDYKVLPCVTPAWDNSPRIGNRGIIFVDSTPDRYRRWLETAIERSTARFVGEERLVFINAWNEWAEGNHLEPDLRWGRSYLEATCRALQDADLAISGSASDQDQERGFSE